jgi:hypothetical protein
MCTEPFSVRFVETTGATACPECGEPQPDFRGPRLFTAGQDQPLCRGCGKRLAPDLGALLELAITAERVGRHCRHLLTPSMEVLLDLARAAENYATATTPVRAG